MFDLSEKKESDNKYIFYRDIYGTYVVDLKIIDLKKATACEGYLAIPMFIRKSTNKLHIPDDKYTFSVTEDRFKRQWNSTKKPNLCDKDSVILTFSKIRHLEILSIVKKKEE